MPRTSSPTSYEPVAPKHFDPAKARPDESGGTERANEEDLSAEEVRSRAYEIFERRCVNGIDGDDVSDWLSAERELRSGRNGHDPMQA